mgnify:CR=1 FL=1
MMVPPASGLTTLELELEFFIVHKEANFDLWDQSIHVFLICVSFLRRVIHTLTHNLSAMMSNVVCNPSALAIIVHVRPSCKE